MQWLINSDGERLMQGTILYGVDFGYGEFNPPCVVLSNACDLEHGKVSFIVLAILVPAKETLRETKEVNGLIDGKDISLLKDRAKKSLLKIYTDRIHNKIVGRYYFFDPRPVMNMDPLLVDFQHVCSCDYSNLLQLISNGKVRLIGQLDHPYVEQMMMQYAGYMGRVPADRLTEEETEKVVGELLV